MTVATAASLLRISLQGNVTELEMAQLCSNMRTLVHPGVCRVELVLKDVSYLGSSALGGLTYLQHSLGKRGIMLVLANPSGHVVEELKTYGMTGMFTIEEGPDSPSG